MSCRAVLLVVLLGACGAPYQEPSAVNPPHDPEPIAEAPRSKTDAPPRLQGGNLPEAVREHIRAQMFEHGQNMENLLWAAIMLQYDNTAKIADWVSHEASERISDGTVSERVPPRFYSLRAEMQAAASDLAGAAEARDDAAMAEAYGRLASTCVRCHSVYLWE